jgi:hypothetical protein
MKTNHWLKTIGVLLLSLGLFKSASSFAQALSVQSGSAIDVAQPDSIVQLTADAQGLALVPPDALPSSGTFWLVMPGINAVPMPCPPKDAYPIYQIADGQFLVDATGGQLAANPQFAGRRMTASEATDALAQQASAVVNLIDQVQEAQLEQAMGISMDDSSGMSPDGLSSMIIGTNLWIVQVSVLGGNLNGTATNTQADIQYSIMSRTNLLQTDWQYEGYIRGSETTNWTPLTVSQNGRPILFLRLRSDADDGSGLPLWWQLQYFGHTGVSPTAADPAGDGWSNLQKFQSGLDPNAFYTPPAPQNLAVSYNSINNTAAVSWQPSLGPVTGYTVEKADSVAGTVQDFNVSASSYSFNDNLSSDEPDLFSGALDVTYKVQAHYGTNGVSTWGGPAALELNTLTANFIAGPQGSAYVAMPSIPAGTMALRVTRFDENAWFWNMIEGGDAPLETNFDISITSSTNGIYSIPSSWNVMLPDAYGESSGYDWFVQTVNSNGVANATGAIYRGYNFPLEDSRSWLVPPYFDGRAQLKQNLIFLLRAATVDSPFSYIEIGPLYNPYPVIYFANFANTPNYAYAGFYQLDELSTDTYPDSYEYLGSFDVYWPFENNYRYRNFVFNSSELDVNGRTTTGAGGNYYENYAFNNYYNGGLMLEYPPTYLFQVPATNGTSIPSLLATNNSRWLASYALDSVSSYLWKIGATNYGTTYGLFSNARNWFGLPILSANLSGSTILNAGSTSPSGGYFYPETAQPQLQTVQYDFWRLSPVPGSANFAITNKSDLMINAVGSPGFSINAYAKMSLQNGYSGVYGYLGQYFDKAYQIDANGNVTTNTTGVLSPYGQFFSTAPGAAALVTMPDPDTGARGTCTVYSVSLQLDRNHDGNMDSYFAGPDSTPQSSPFIFWCNNNFDRQHMVDFNVISSDSEQDDLLPGVEDFSNLDPDDPDYNYKDLGGNRVIPCTRDLEDFARLWVSGITPDLVSNLPYGSTVTLSWGDMGNPNPNNPTIDIFQSAEVAGGIGYLTNETTAVAQIDPSSHLYMGRIAPGQGIQLTAYLFENSYGRNHLIWCGVSNGIGQLTMTINDGNNNMLAQSSASIQIEDIKQMYERWTVGDNPSIAPTNTPSLTGDGVPYAFQYSPALDTNTSYILFVHGWNEPLWEKDRFAETAYKRLYWQGYQGRFGEFRWPTYYDFIAGEASYQAIDLRNFDNSEYNAWQSGAGLLNLLSSLNVEYPGHVYLFAHSMGNIVAGEALRQAGANRVINTYVAMQAAVAAHTYDPTTPTRALIDGGVNLDSGTPDRYAAYWTNNAPCYFNGTSGAGKYVNFFNVNDWALTLLWQPDQDIKPDLGYGYITNTDLFYKNFYNTALFFPTNTYEIFSYADEARSYALGAQPHTGGVFKKGFVFQEVELDSSPFNFGSSHKYHSGEFRSDTPQRWQFWNQVLLQMGLKQP